MGAARDIVEAGPRLESLPGVGPALARKIRAAYGSDAGFLEACRELRLEPLLALEGLSERRAFDLVSRLRSETTPELARTDRAREVRRDLEERLASFARTDFGRRYVRLLPILRDADQIHERAESVMRMRRFVEACDRSAVASALARLAPLRESPRPAGVRRAILVANEDEEMQLRGRGLDRWCRILHGARPELDPEDFDVVLDAGSESSAALDAFPNVARVPLDAPPWRFVPELEVEFARINRPALEAMAQLARLVDRPSAAPRVVEALASAPAAGPVDVEGAARAALQEAQRLFESRVAGLSLSGPQVLEVLQRGTSSSLDELRKEAVAAGRSLFRERAGVDADVFEAGIPLRLDEEEVERVRTELAARSALFAFERTAAAARAIHATRDALAQELQDWLRFDAEFALGSFAADHDCQPAASGPVLRFQAGVNLRLPRGPATQPVSYEVGGPHAVAVLTGANSGGKTTLLELLSQIVLLHHWGLPVPARDATVPLLDELLHFGAQRGGDAGALETFLRELFPPLTRPGRRLVLLDEVESLTELEAAARILGVFLEEVGRAGSLCVLVSHLPNEILHATRARVRMDGIDAVGLDDQFNLLVDRQPKLGHRARSTPELILRRVHAKSRGPTKDLFGRILSRWPADEART